jgi:hypothetical protein
VVVLPAPVSGARGASARTQRARAAQRSASIACAQNIVVMFVVTGTRARATAASTRPRYAASAFASSESRNGCTAARGGRRVSSR